MSHSCPNLVSTSFLYNPYIPFLNLQKFFIYYNIYNKDWACGPSAFLYIYTKGLFIGLFIGLFFWKIVCIFIFYFLRK